MALKAVPWCCAVTLFSMFTPNLIMNGHPHWSTCNANLRSAEIGRHAGSRGLKENRKALFHSHAASQPTTRRQFPTKKAQSERQSPDCQDGQALEEKGGSSLLVIRGNQNFKEHNRVPLFKPSGTTLNDFSLHIRYFANSLTSSEGGAKHFWSNASPREERNL